MQPAGHSSHRVLPAPSSPCARFPLQAIQPAVWHPPTCSLCQPNSPIPDPPFVHLQARAPSRPAARTLCCAAAGPWRTEAAGPALPSTPAAGEGLSQLGAAVSNGQAAQMGTCCTQQATWSPRKAAGPAPLSACGSPRFGCQVRREGAQAAEQPCAADCSLNHTHQRRLTPLLQLQMHYSWGS